MPTPDRTLIATIIEHEGTTKASFIAAQDGENQRVESAEFDDFELAANWIRKRIGESIELDDPDTLADRLTPQEIQAEADTSNY